MIELPPPAWEIFDICDKCQTDAKQPCYDLRSTSKNLVELTWPHHGRKRLKPEDPWHSVLPV